ncbi:MAG: hypothetical protein VKJ04_01425 [Vampirovibrionales bacterium]|nr:hypothetical protein [Vampirovibrionales bacterium]
MSALNAFERLGKTVGPQALESLGSAGAIEQTICTVLKEVKTAGQTHSIDELIIRFEDAARRATLNGELDSSGISSVIEYCKKLVSGGQTVRYGNRLTNSGAQPFALAEIVSGKTVTCPKSGQTFPMAKLEVASVPAGLRIERTTMAPWKDPYDVGRDWIQLVEKLLTNRQGSVQVLELSATPVGSAFPERAVFQRFGITDEIRGVTTRDLPPLEKVFATLLGRKSV